MTKPVSNGKDGATETDTGEGTMNSKGSWWRPGSQRGCRTREPGKLCRGQGEYETDSADRVGAHM